VVRRRAPEIYVPFFFGGAAAKAELNFFFLIGERGRQKKSGSFIGTISGKSNSNFLFLIKIKKNLKFSIRKRVGAQPTLNGQLTKRELL